jgi:signal transduction histidine kinase
MAASLEAAQRELLDANQDLEERVRDRTRELEAEHEKLLRAERLSSLGLLSSAIAHDLRSPLNTVTLGMHWLQLRIGDTADDRVKARMEMIQRELRRSEQIIKTLLAFARTGEPDRHPADVNELVQEVVDVVHPPGNVRIEVSLDERIPEANVDRAQLFQVLENLIRNAVQAMPEGGAVRVTTESGLGKPLFRVRVADTGPGIPEEMQVSVFDALVTTKSTGTGLGLALCKRIVDAHEGRIWVESRPGDGATFHVELPLDAAVPQDRVRAA